MSLPDAIHDNARRQRVLSARQPLSERQPQPGRLALRVAWTISIGASGRAQHFEKSRLNFGSWRFRASSLQQADGRPDAHVPKRLQLLELATVPVPGANLRLEFVCRVSIRFAESLRHFRIANLQARAKFTEQVLLNVVSFLFWGPDRRSCILTDRFREQFQLLIVHTLLLRLYHVHDV